MPPQKKTQSVPLHPGAELRQDIVSGEWVLLATGRAKRPKDFMKKKEAPYPASSCPFEDPQKSGNGNPLLWYPALNAKNKDDFKNWFVQVIPNKFPAVMPHHENTCASLHGEGIYKTVDGVGYHEVVITRSHTKSIGFMKPEEAELVIKVYRERYLTLKKDPCLAYVSLFHNHGHEAGASIMHPHSQLIGMPIIPPDVVRSIHGSERFFKKEKTCVHCHVFTYERRVKKRVVFENDLFIAFAPFASHRTFELRIYPKKHNPYFETIDDKETHAFAEALTTVLRKLCKTLNNPPYNFFVHTTPLIGNAGRHYHWHLEILPSTNIPAGLELGTGVDVVTVAPEEVPSLFESA